MVTKVKLESISSYNRRRGAGPTIGGMVELVLGAEQDYEVSRELHKLSTWYSANILDWTKH